MIDAAEYPNLQLDPAEQAGLFIQTASLAGSLMTEKYADLYLDMGVRDGMLDEQGSDSHVIVHGMAAGHSSSLLLHGNADTGDTSCKFTSRTRETPLVSEPVTLTAASDMLQRVRDEADPLPGDRLVPLLRGARGGPDLMLVPSTELVPVVAGLTQAIGTALLRPRGEGQLVDARLRYNIGSSGRVYGDFGWRNRRNEMYLSVADRETRKRLEFGLEFWFGLVHDDVESSFVQCSLKTTGPEINTTVETLGTYNDGLWVTPNHNFRAGYKPQTNGIADLGGQALALLGANLGAVSRQ